MGILVICSYRPKPGHEDEARLLMQGHVPLLRAHGLITELEKSRGAPALPEIGAHWKAMSAVMDFVPLAQLPEAQQAFAHFNPIG